MHCQKRGRHRQTVGSSQRVGPALYLFRRSPARGMENCRGYLPRNADPREGESSQSECQASFEHESHNLLRLPTQQMSYALGK